MNAEPLSITVWSDIVCPWCYIGLTRLEQALEATKIDARIELKPFFLRAETPEEGIDLGADLRAKYGVEPRVLFATVEAAARSSGLPIDFGNVTRTYPTVKAHTLLRHAERMGCQRVLSRALFEAYFLRGEAISDTLLLAGLARRHGFGEGDAETILANPAELEQTRREALEGPRLGIHSVPFFVFDRRFSVSGAQSVAVFEQALRRARPGAVTSYDAKL